MCETTGTTAESGAADRIRTAAAALAHHRGGPCLLVVSRSLVHADVLTVRKVLATMAGDHLHVIVAGPGGVSEAAYLLARELRRRFAQLTAYVPFLAKSAATVLCLAAEELVLGSLGELGPLDQQYEEKQQADYPLNTSRLLPGVALRHLQEGATALYDTLVRQIVKESGLRPLEAGSKATELIGALYAPLYQQLDPARLATCARELAVGKAYAERVLRRYRPALWAESGPKILDRLVQEYPTHGFVLDREELDELGLPTRVPDDTEAALLDRLALALLEFGTDDDLIEMVGPPHKPGTGAQTASEPTRARRMVTAATKVRRHRSRPRETEAA
jgi:Serine dehydrogenase proteinase